MTQGRGTVQGGRGQSGGGGRACKATCTELQATEMNLSPLRVGKSHDTLSLGRPLLLTGPIPRMRVHHVTTCRFCLQLRP